MTEIERLTEQLAAAEARAEALQATLTEERAVHRNYMLQAGDLFTRQALAIDALQADRDTALKVLNPVCAEETVVGAIRNLQQALLSMQGNVEEAEARADAAERALREAQDGRDTAITMKLGPALAQLRHAYWNLTDLGLLMWATAQRREFAEGLIAPQIRRLEEMEAALASPPVPILVAVDAATLRDLAIRWRENRCGHEGEPDDSLDPYCCPQCVADADENVLPLLREAIALVLTEGK